MKREVWVWRRVKPLKMPEKDHFAWDFSLFCVTFNAQPLDHPTLILWSKRPLKPGEIDIPRQLPSNVAFLFSSTSNGFPAPKFEAKTQLLVSRDLTT